MQNIHKQENTYNGFYRGVVVNNEDPLYAGRLQIMISPMYDGFDLDAIPWAIMADSTMGGSGDIGTSNIPQVDAHLFLFFENGDFRFPVYFASAPAIQDNEPDLPHLSRKDDETHANINAQAQKGVLSVDGNTWDEPDSTYDAKYPQNKVYKSKNGFVVEIDDSDDNVRFHLLHPSGTRTEIDSIGNVMQRNINDKYEITISNSFSMVGGNADVVVKGNVNLKVDGNVTAEIGGNFKSTIDGDTDIITKGKTNIDTVSDTVVKSGSKIDVIAPSVAIDASTSIKLDGGTIDLKGSAIKIDGASVHITGGGTIVGGASVALAVGG